MEIELAGEMKAEIKAEPEIPDPNEVKLQLEIKPESEPIDNRSCNWQPAKKSNLAQQGGGLVPRGRHGHRIVSIRGLILLFGGGNNEIMDDLMVYSTENGNWFKPSCSGEIPPGVAAHGMIADGTRIVIHGGMMEYGKMTNNMYELQASKWEWKELIQKGIKNTDVPSARMSHSFTSLGSVGKVVLFGGVTNKSDAPERMFRPEYFNDLYYLELKGGSGIYSWSTPECTGAAPSVRESHSAVVFKPEGRAQMVIIYGGKDQRTRLGDIFSLDTGTNTWTELKPLGNPPKARSLHSAAMISDTKMVILGGIVPKSDEKDKLMNNSCPSGKDIWRSDDGVYVLDLSADEWAEKGIQGEVLDKLPSRRYGLTAAVVNSQIYIFAGKENDENCTNEMCFLETKVPNKPLNLRLMKGLETEIHVAWSSIKNAEKYLVQCSPVSPAKKPDQSKEHKELPKETASPEKADSKEDNKMEVDKSNNEEAGTKTEQTPSPLPQPKSILKPEIEWFDVQLVKQPTTGQNVPCEIKSYFLQAEEGESLSEDEKCFLDSEKKWKKINLSSGVTYRVRVSALNSCGRSIFSDFGSYKTSTPGFPGAPWNIKVSKTESGASLAWQPPPNAEVIEYSVYLAVKSSQPSGKSTFTRVYMGHDPACVVSHGVLSQAATTTSESAKSAVIFRIAAKNKKGYGPATQVRWIQDAKIKRPANAQSNKDAKKAK